MSEGERPIPVPRPRQQKSSDETDASSKVYENYTLPKKQLESVYDNLNAQINELKQDNASRAMPVPVPRLRVTTTPKPDYENSPETAKPLNNQQREADVSPSKTTGAIRKAPNIPKVNNRLDDRAEPPQDDKSQKDFDVLSQTSSTSGKSSSDSRFTTPSPGQIFKSIGSSSKMLRESIGERLSEKTSSAKHKLLKEYKNTKNAVGSVTTKKLKVVKTKINDFSLKRNKNKNSFTIQEDERPRTISLGDNEMMQSLTFNSPLNNRSYNLGNLPQDVSTYEIPKSLNRRSSADLPSYDDVLKDQEFLNRNTSLTQSMYSTIQKPNNLAKKNFSESNLHTISSDSSESSDDHESEPPNIPAPELPDQIYGKIKKLPSTDYENAPMIPLRKAPAPPGNKAASSRTLNDFSDSDKATVCGSLSERSSFDIASRKSLNITAGVDRSESWRYVDSISRDTIESDESHEPIYTNDENEKVGSVEPTYGEVFKAQANLLEPLKPINIMDSNRKSNSVARDILNEFDPLSRESFDAFIMTKMNHLSLLETLLSEETYGAIEDHYIVPSEEQIGENSSVESVNIPTPPERNDSLAKEEAEAKVECAQIKDRDEAGAAPIIPLRTKKNETKRKSKVKTETPRAASVIIHQNLRLKDSVENLVEAYSARVEDDEPSTSQVVDLSRPKPAPPPSTSWFVVEDDANKFLKNNLDNPNINHNTPTDKLAKTIPQLSKVNNFEANRDHLPTYEESKHDEIVNIGAVEKTPEPTSKPLSSLFSFGLKRKSSLKENKLEAKDFVQRPPFAEDSHHQDKSVILFKLPSGVIEDILKELNPRFVEVKRRQFKAYSDSEFKVLKEHLDFTHLASVQYLANHKFTEFKTESGRQIYCFEINLAVPKNSSSTNALLDSKGSLAKTQRVTYVYGIHSKTEKCLWMQKIIRSVTNVFPKEYTLDFTRAGWGYMKKSISSPWSGTWLMLSRRKLLFYDFTESRLVVLDLRKARCIGLKDSDESTNNLFTEKGPTILLDCPPYTCYFAMNTARETKIWSVVIKDEAHTNGTQLRHQQLTKDDVPVFVDKCINFIYTNGTMSEGIYRKAGASTNVQKLMSALKQEAFAVQITRSEYNEHDVSTALKRFFRELPEPLMGKLAVSFLSVSEMKSNSEKIESYKELLQRLPVIEYQTLKKLLGHLHFIQAQRGSNKMKAENLAMVFGPTLMQPNNNENQYQMDSRDNDVIAELIMNYKKLYELSADEIKTEQIMLTVLQKYHSAAENLSDTVKQSGDFKIWITIDPNPEFNLKQEDKKQVNIAITPQKTVFELCKELESQMKTSAHEMTLMEVILNGELQRPLHHNEKVLNTVLRWANWPEDDRKTNYLELKPKTKFQEQIERAMKTLPCLTPSMELKFADRKTKSMKLFTLELVDTTVNVLKAEKSTNVKVKDVDVSNCIAYLGAEKKRDHQLRWALTLIELNFSKRNRDSPFIGHIMGGQNINDQVTWFTSILYSLHGYDIAPNPEIVIA